jgi:hypothetical protein
MRAVRDSTYPYHSVGRIRTARCHAPALGSSAVGDAPLAAEPRRTYSGYAASVVNAHACRWRAIAECSQLAATQHYFRNALPTGVSCSIRGNSAGGVLRAARPGWSLTRLRRGKLQKRAVWGLTKR